MIRRLAGIFIAAAFFCAIAPTLSLLQFGDPIENLNVATAMEIRRGGPWLFPTLQGEPRLAKPPVTAWVTAAFLRRSTLANIEKADPSARAAALKALAFQVRLPALLAMCGMLAVVYELGQTIADGNAADRCRAGWISAVVCGSTFLFLRQCRLATTDAQLALLVSAANLFLAKAFLEKRQWVGSIGAGAALGIAFMIKGPIALAQSVLPFAAFILCRGMRRSSGADCLPCRPFRARPLIAGILVMLLFGLTWYVSAAAHFSGARSLWLAEATRIGADAPPSGAPWYRYIVCSWLFYPWLIWLGVGVAMALAGGAWRMVWHARLSLLLFAMPLFLMSFSRDRYERYMTPMLPAAAMLAGGALAAYVGGRPDDAVESAETNCGSNWGAMGKRTRLPVMSAAQDGLHGQASTLAHGTQAISSAHGPAWRSVATFHRCLPAHLLLIGVGVAGFSAAGASGLFPALRTAFGTPWFTPATAAVLCAGGVALVSVSAILNRLWRGWPILVTAVVVLIGQAIYFNRLSESTSSHSTMRPVADLILARFPNAELYGYRPNGQNIISVPANDLSIHLDRTVSLVADPSRIIWSGRSQIYVIYRTRKPSQAEMAPPTGWSVLTRPPAGGNEDRYVFVRDGTSGNYNVRFDKRGAGR